MNENPLIGRPLADIDLTAVALSLSQPGHTMSSIARQLHISRSTLYRHLNIYDHQQILETRIDAEAKVAHQESKRRSWIEVRRAARLNARDEEAARKVRLQTQRQEMRSKMAVARTVPFLGRPPKQFDVELARTLLADKTKTVAQVASVLGISRNTLYYRRRSEVRAYSPSPIQLRRTIVASSKPIKPNPWCIQHRVRMRKHEAHGYVCPACRQEHPPRIGRPLKEIDCERVSRLLQTQTVISVALILSG